VTRTAVAQVRGHARWREARHGNDFALFAPALEELVELRLGQARQLLPAEAPGLSRWEVLAQPTLRAQRQASSAR